MKYRLYLEHGYIIEATDQDLKEKWTIDKKRVVAREVISETKSSVIKPVSKTQLEKERQEKREAEIGSADAILARFKNAMPETQL